MASLSDHHYFYSDYIFSNLDHLPTPMSSSDGSSELNNLPSSNNNIIGAGCFNHSSSSGSSVVLPFEYSSDISSSTASMAAFLGSEQQNHLTSALHGNYEHGDLWNNSYQKMGGVYEVGEECSSGGLSLDSSHFWPPVYPITVSAGENWTQAQEKEKEIQGGNMGMISMEQRVEDSTLKVARYSAEERKDRIIRYLKKRSQRNFNKTIKYACRKTLADKRVRVRGRFAKNNELSDDDHQTLTLNSPPHHHHNHDHHVINVNNHFCHDQRHSFYPSANHHDHLIHQMMKPTSEEEWLQEAIASLMHYRVVPDVQLFN